MTLNSPRLLSLSRGLATTLAFLATTALVTAGPAPAEGRPATAARAADQPPSSMKKLVYNARHLTSQSFTLGETHFEALTPFSRLPHLLWLATGSRAPFESERAAVLAWLTKHMPSLGGAGFVPVFDRLGTWRGNNVWSYRLEREGVHLHAARIDVHWRDGAFEGIHSVLPGPIASISGALSATAPKTEQAWFASPQNGRVRGAVDVKPVSVRVRQVGGQSQTTYVSGTSATLLTVIGGPVFGQTPIDPVVRPHEWKEYPVPSGTFPDQISSDSSGRIWFSQPSNDQVTIFDPVSETFSSIPIGSHSPDGLMVDSSDNVWTGLYTSGSGLGRIDAATGVFTRYPASYSGAQMAIPYRATSGSVWVTDHQRNRISEFDPVSTTWLGSYTMPSASAWVVDGTEDPGTQTLYFTEYSVNKLAVKAPGTPVTEVSVSSGGPAFNRFSAGKVYYTLWVRDRLGAYDVTSGTNVEYPYPVAGENGGPIDTMSNGDLVIGSLNQGWVFVFRLATQTFEGYQIPTGNPGLKDGLHLAANDVIWITETTGGNKIACLKIY